LSASAATAGDLGVVQQFDQRVHVVAAHHGAQQLGGAGLGDQAHLDVAMRHGGQEAGLDLGRVVHARGHAVGQQIHQEGLFTGGRVLDQLDQVGHLFGIQRQGRDAQGGALGGMGSVGFQHFAFSCLKKKFTEPARSPGDSSFDGFADINQCRRRIVF
jgi:hypothetical protein